MLLFGSAHLCHIPDPLISTPRSNLISYLMYFLKHFIEKKPYFRHFSILTSAPLKKLGWYYTIHTLVAIN